MIRIEFWNGQTSNKPKYNKYDGLITTKKMFILIAFIF